MRRAETAALAAERARRHGWGEIRGGRLDMVEVRRGDVVLDVGCSGGSYVDAARAQGASAIGLDLLCASGWEGGIYGMADARRLPIQTQGVDTVMAFEVLEHVEEPWVALSEWRRVCRRQLVLSVPNTSPPPWAQTAGLTYHHYVDRTHVNCFDAPSLAEVVASTGFRVEVVVPILPVHPFVPALDALGFPASFVHRIGPRLSRFARRRYGSSLLLRAQVA